MDTAFLRQQSDAILGHYAAGLLVTPEAFATAGITFVERAADHVWPYAALAVTAPGGSVVSVAPGLLEFAKEHRPRKHYEVTAANFLSQIAGCASAHGLGGRFYGQSICWALRTVPALPVLPGGLRFQQRDAVWMNAEQANMRFENGVGEPGVAGRAFRNKWAATIVDDAGEPIAVAGVFDTFGLDEIGVDVLRAHRDARLGAAVVAAATRGILDRGGTPFYGCGAANIRSQRTAASVGYVPLFTDASVA